MAKLEEELNMKFGNEKFRCITGIVYTSNYIQKCAGDFLAQYGLSSPQFNILRILRGAKEPLTMNEIKHRMIEKSPHTTRLVNKLLDKGWVERSRSETDRRVVYIHITKGGLSLLSEIDKYQEEMVGFIQNITEEEAKMVSDVLEKLRK